MSAMQSKPRTPVLLLVVLGALSAFGPLSMDLYLPAMPALANSLRTTDSLAQFTISACMIGLAGGQLFSGPLSDRIGRRVPLLIGVSMFVVASILCALAPTIELLLLARFLQGLAGAAGIVISRAVVRDLFDERETARVFSRLTIITGTAPVVAPIVGGALLLVTDWRGTFIALALIGLVLLIAAALVVPDSLEPENRHSGGVASQLVQMGTLLRDGRFMAYALAMGIGGVALFAYISMSPLVLQDDYGVSPQIFAVIFAVNSVGIVAVGQLNGALVERVQIRRLLMIALVVVAVAGGAVVGAAAAGLGVFFLLVPVFLAVAAQGAIGPNTTALALGPFKTGIGAASAVLGTSQFLVGAIVPPLASLAGTNGVVMGLTMLGGGVVAIVLIATMTGGAAQRNDSGDAAVGRV